MTFYFLRRKDKNGLIKAIFKYADSDKIVNELIARHPALWRETGLQGQAAESNLLPALLHKDFHPIVTKS